MAKITDFDELKKRYERAKLAKVGDKDWIDFATTMLDSFPAIYDTAKKMNNAHKEHLEILERVAGCITDMGWDQLEKDVNKILER